MTITDVPPATNADGFDLMAHHQSPHKARAYHEASLVCVELGYHGNVGFSLAMDFDEPALLPSSATRRRCTR